jgi:hypothetical protein
MSDENMPFEAEIILVPEDFKKVITLTQRAAEIIDKSRESLPVYLRNLITSADVTPDLREDSPNRVMIVTTFSFNFSCSKFTFQKQMKTCFYIEYLSPNFENEVEKKFVLTATEFIKQFCSLLYGTADELHAALTEIPH